MLTDGVGGISEGQVADDGMLIQPVSVRSKQVIITFPDGSEPITLEIDHSGDDDEGEEDDETV